MLRDATLTAVGVPLEPDAAHADFELAAIRVIEEVFPDA